MRPLSAYLRNVPKAHRYAAWFGSACATFTQPLGFLLHYVRQSVPRRGLVQMRDGTRIHLSGHAHDVITLFVIFVRRDYGRLPAAATVVDMGANIGAFALFAAREGARKVIAFEPNSAAYACLRRNISENGLEGVVLPRRLAVTASAGDQVRFPVAASVYNRIAAPDALGEHETVPTTSLARIVDDDAPGGIDVLKLDCEGAEYDILLAPDAPLERVREIRMEYHGGRGAELAQSLARRGFSITRFVADSPLTGMLWARRTAA
jgi:FkbM family methyltransferase